MIDVLRFVVGLTAAVVRRRAGLVASLRAASRESPFSGGSITTTAEPRDLPEQREPHGPMCG
jgi:hypothetical protein